jgi:hypothetical protein
MIVAERDREAIVVISVRFLMINQKRVCSISTISIN